MRNLKSIFKVSALLILSSILFVGCDESLVVDKENTSPPTISEFSPKNGEVGTAIKISGENLQKLDSITIGGELATIKYMVNSKEVVIVVSPDNKSGKLKFFNVNGEFETEETFTITYAAPSFNLTTLPTTAKANDQISIEGTRMDVVKQIYFGTTLATIVNRDETQLVVSVPFFEEDNVDIVLIYMSESGEKKVSTTGAPFSLAKVAPAVDTYPTSAKSEATITLTGTNLGLVDKVMFDTFEGSIISKTDTEIHLMVPKDYPATSNSVVLKLIYNGTKEVVVTNSFELIVPTIYYWANKTIYANDVSTTDNFFDAMTGNIYTPCDFPAKDKDIYFFLSSSSTQGIRMNNPYEASGQIKNFRCNGVNLPSQRMANIVKFRRLRTVEHGGAAKEEVLIDKVKNKTLTYVDADEIVGITVETNNLIRNTTVDYTLANTFYDGDVIIFQHTNEGVIKTGFIEILKFTSDNPMADKKSSITFNCYFEK